MHVGGAFDICMRSSTGEEHWTRGTFVEVTLHARLVIDMLVTDKFGKELMRAYTEVEFSDALGGTRMDVTQTYTFIDPSLAAPMVAGAPEGWRTHWITWRRRWCACRVGPRPAQDRSSTRHSIWNAPTTPRLRVFGRR
jgi:uncharacterized protein YndB with AHSA1/START domain